MNGADPNISGVRLPPQDTQQARVALEARALTLQPPPDLFTSILERVHHDEDAKAFVGETFQLSQNGDRYRITEALYVASKQFEGSPKSIVFEVARTYPETDERLLLKVGCSLQEVLVHSVLDSERPSVTLSTGELVFRTPKLQEWNFTRGEHQRPIIIRELDAGVTLVDYVANRVSEKPYTELLAVLRSGIEGLKNLHQQGIIHTDAVADDMLVRTFPKDQPVVSFVDFERTRIDGRQRHNPRRDVNEDFLGVRSTMEPFASMVTQLSHFLENETQWNRQVVSVLKPFRELERGFRLGVFRYDDFVTYLQAAESLIAEERFDELQNLQLLADGIPYDGSTFISER